MKQFNWLLPLIVGSIVLALTGLIGQLAGPETAKTEYAIAAGSDRVQVCPQLEGGFEVVAAAANDQIALSDFPIKKAVEPSPVVKEFSGKPTVLTDVSGVPAVGVTHQEDLYDIGASCDIPRSEGWIQLPDSSNSDILVINSASQEASVKAEVFGPDGEIIAPGSSGIVVPAFGSRLVPISAFVPEPTPVGVKITATTGRVAIFGRSRQLAGNDFVAATTPNTTVTIPGVVTGVAGARAVITNPNRDIAVAQVGLLGENGRFVPTGVEEIEVPGYSTVSVDISEEVAKGTFGFQISAKSQVVGTVAVIANSDATLVTGCESAKNLQQVSWTQTSTLVLTNVSDQPSEANVSIAGAKVKQQLNPFSSLSMPIPEKGVLVQVSADNPLVGAITSTTKGISTIQLQALPDAERGIPVKIAPQMF